VSKSPTVGNLPKSLRKRLHMLLYGSDKSTVKIHGLSMASRSIDIPFMIEPKRFEPVFSKKQKPDLW